MALCVGVMKYKNCKCRRRTWLLTTGTAGANATLMAGSAGDIRLCMDTSPAWWAERAIRWMTWPSRVYVWSCVYDFARFVYLPHCSELYSAALSLCMRFGAPRRLNLTAEIALASPHPPRCYAPRSHMHTGASAHATNQADAYTLGGAGKGEYLCHSVFLFCFHTSLVRSE